MHPAKCRDLVLDSLSRRVKLSAIGANKLGRVLSAKEFLLLGNVTNHVERYMGNKERVGAVCVDVINLGIVSGPFGSKHKIKVIWEAEQKNENGYPVRVSNFYNLSLHAKSNLRRDLLSWRGRDLNDTELSNGFDTESLKNLPCTLEIQDAISSTGNAYLKVLGVYPAEEKPYEASGTYRRWVPILINGERKEAA